MPSDHRSGVSGGPPSSMRDEVVSAVMRILVESGPDAVHLSRVASSTGLSLVSVEETYGHPGELLYSAWDSVLRAEFEVLVAQARDLMVEGSSSLVVDESPSSLRRATAHLLVVAHRFDELRDTVAFDVQRILFGFDHESMTTGQRSALRAMIGWLLGIALEPGQRYGDSLRLLHRIDWGRQLWASDESSEAVVRTPAMAIDFEEMSELSREILIACTRIVAQGGLGRATLLRIARMAGYPPELVYGMYGRQEHLIAEYMKSVFSLLFSYRRFEEYMDSPAHATMRLEVWLEPELQIRRRALLESVMASNFSPFLESAFVEAAEGALADMRLSNLQMSEDLLEIASVRFIASRQVTLGLAILEEVELERWDRTWSPFLRAFLAEPH